MTQAWAAMRLGRIPVSCSGGHAERRLWRPCGIVITASRGTQPILLSSLSVGAQPTRNAGANNGRNNNQCGRCASRPADQLKRLIAQKIWISDASKATLAEIEAQVIELKRLLAQLETDIQNQIKRGV